MYDINKKFEIKIHIGYNPKENIILTYKGIIEKSGLESINECSINIIKDI